MDSTKKNNSYKKWKEEILDPAEKRFAPRKETFRRSDGSPIETLYWPESPLDYEAKVGFPGQYPFTRGVQPNMYRGRMWTMRQYAGFGSAQESNARYRSLLEQGQTGLSVAFDLPTQMGYDSDHPLSAGEVGKVGVAIDSIDDMRTLFKDIPLDRVSTSMTINATAATLLSMYIAVAQEQDVSPDKLKGTIQNDVLKEYVARGTYIYPAQPSLRLITDIFEYCSKEVPSWNTISISGYHIREAGADAVQEVAFTLSDAIAYVDAAINIGLDVDKFAGRLAFFFSKFKGTEEKVQPALKISQETENRQKEALHQFKTRRDSAAVTWALEQITQSAREDTNLMPPILHAVRSHATMGEITVAMEEVFGLFEEIVDL